MPAWAVVQIPYYLPLSARCRGSGAYHWQVHRFSNKCKNCNADFKKKRGRLVGITKSDGYQVGTNEGRPHKTTANDSSTQGNFHQNNIVITPWLSRKTIWKIIPSIKLHKRLDFCEDFTIQSVMDFWRYGIDFDGSFCCASCGTQSWNRVENLPLSSVMTKPKESPVVQRE